MSKFTKGKWKYLDNLYQVVSYPEDEHVFYDGNAPALWHNITGELNIGLNNSEEEAHANGRLIAAAPDMYVFLNECVNSMPPDICRRLKKKALHILARIDSNIQEGEQNGIQKSST